VKSEDRLWPHKSVGFYPIGYGRGKLSDSNRQIRHFGQRFKSRQDEVGLGARLKIVGCGGSVQIGEQDFVIPLWQDSCRMI